MAAAYTSRLWLPACDGMTWAEKQPGSVPKATWPELFPDAVGAVSWSGPLASAAERMRGGVGGDLL